jgi:microcystin degradation protein MlrC
MRIAIAMIMQETHSFSPLSTGIKEFRESPLVPLLTGQELLSSHRGTESEVDGFIRVCEEAEIEMVPLFTTFAVTSGPVTSEAYLWLKTMLTDQLRDAGRLDGVLIALHGAMAADGEDDPEGDILRTIKGIVGDIPVGCSLDLHCNLTKKMKDNAEILVSYETHVDYSLTGERVARLLLRCIREGIRPHHYLRKLPMVLGSSHSMLAEKRQKEIEDDNVLTISILACNPWTDVVEFGPAVLVTAKAADERTQTMTDNLAAQYWENREDIAGRGADMDEAVAAALANVPAPKGPVILVDGCDLTGGGGTGDDVTTLTKLIEAGGTDFAAIIYDPEAVDMAFELGEGSKGVFAIGGKFGWGGVGPLRFEGSVEKLYEGDYTLRGTPYGGLRTPLGKTALVSAGSKQIVLTSKRLYPQGSAVFEALDMDVSSKQAIVCKGFSAGAGTPPFVMPFKESLTIDSPGMTIWDFTKVPYQVVSRPRFPMDDVDDPSEW